jgi:hypothetical protein
MARKASWNERVRYVADPDRERMHLQSEFVSVLYNQHPGIVRSLQEEVFPAWLHAARALQNLAERWKIAAHQNRELAPYAACLNSFEAAQQVESHSLPECLEARRSR